MSPKGGSIVCLWIPTGDLPRKDVSTVTTLAYTMLGEDMSFGEDLTFKMDPGDRPLFVRWAKIIPELLRDGKIKVRKVTS